MGYIRQQGILNYSKHGLFVTWRMMNVRCYDSRHKAYYCYGGKGISVCEQWKWDNPFGFFNFIKDVGERPINHTLDRIDGDCGYSKINCKWSTKREQQNNLSIFRNNTSGFQGVSITDTHCLSKIYLNGSMCTVGVFDINNKEKANERYLLIKECKMLHGDIKAKELWRKLDGVTPINKKPYYGKTSKHYGVSWDKSRSKWRAATSFRMKEGEPLINKMVGRFDSEDEAGLAVLEFLSEIKELGYFKQGY